MKWIFGFSILFFAISCSQDKKESTQEKKGESKQQEQQNDTSKVDGSENTYANNPAEINFKDFPNDWILLTQVDSVDGLRIVSYCDAQTPQFYFNLKGEVSFSMNYGQSTDNYLVESFNIHSDSDSVMKGEFTLTNPSATNIFTINEPVTFKWHKNQHYAAFSGLRKNIEVEYFCVNDPQPHFGIIKEPCEEF